MKSAIITTMLSLGIAFSASTAYGASVTGLNTDLLADTAGSWYFNWTAESPAIHHEPAGFGGAGDHTTVSGGSLDYSGPVRASGEVVDVDLSVTGFSLFDTDDLFSTPEIIRQDYWSGRSDHGIGVMTEGTNSEEQVNVLDVEYLRLSFSDSITLLGFDFSSGEHEPCGTTTSCGGFELFTYDGSIATLVAAQLLTSSDYATFGNGIIGNDFLIRATPPIGMTGELGWYLGGVAGDAVIPLPAALPLFLTGLAGLGFLRRRQRKA